MILLLATTLFLVGDVLKPGSGEQGQPSTNSFFGQMALEKGEYVVYARGRNSKGEEWLRGWGGRVKPK